MVSVGVLAAVGMQRLKGRWSAGLDRLGRRAPYVSGVLIALVGAGLAWQGWSAFGR